MPFQKTSLGPVWQKTCLWTGSYRTPVEPHTFWASSPKQDYCGDTHKKSAEKQRYRERAHVKKGLDVWNDHTVRTKSILEIPTAVQATPVEASRKVELPRMVRKVDFDRGTEELLARRQGSLDSWERWL